MPSKRSPIVDLYVETYEKYLAQYPKCAVFIENGFFMEIYGYNETDPQFEICSLLDLNVAKRDKSDEDSSYFGGVPTHSIKKYYKKLINQNYTIICVTQQVKPPKSIQDMERKQITRKVTKILSPGCALSEDISDDCSTGQSVIVGLFFEQDTDGELYAYLGIVDINLGQIELESIYTEVETTTIDNASLLAMVKERLDGILFHEILLTLHSHFPSQQPTDFHHDMIEQLQLQYKLCHFQFIDQKKEYLLNPKFHEHYLIKTFPQYHNIYNTIYHNLDIEHIEPECITNFIILNQFISDHDSSLAMNLPKPIWKHYTKQDHNVITYNDVYQKLNIFESLGDNKKSLLYHIDFTKTGAGGRLFRQRLQCPITNVTILNQRYNVIEELIQQQSLCSEFDKMLNIIDLQRVYRRVNIGQLQPYEIPQLCQANKLLIKLFTFVNQNKETLPLLHDMIHDSELPTKLMVYNSIIEHLFDLEKCYRVSFANLETNLFLKGHFTEIDELTKQIEHCQDFYSLARGYFESLVEQKLPGGNNNHVTLNKGKEDYTFELTKKKGSLFEGIIETLSNDEKQKMEQEFDFSVEDIEINHQNKTKTKITIKNKNHDLFKKMEYLTYTLVLKVKVEYVNQLHKLYDEFYKETIEPAIHGLMEIDYYHACAKCAIRYNYVKPLLHENEKSKLHVEQLRHPIIERLTQKSGSMYVPNDLVLDEEHSYLLYGVNSVGKSSLLKSIALAVIMAQSGMYVPARSMVLSPYKSIFARTGNDDNLFVAHSSFVKEMVEAKKIIKHADQNSLIIADELCASTESNSALAIVSSLLKIISDRQSSFIFATHLFGLCETEMVRSLTNVHCLHLKVRFENQSLIFERTLSEGLPENRLYGVLVANKVIGNTEFDLLTRQVIQPPTERTIPVKSKYNGLLWMEECALCHYTPNTKELNSLPLDTHHIHMQSCSNEEGFIDHYHKNELHNLVSLCKACHTNVHLGKLIINGYMETDQGRVLDWHRKEEITEKSNVAVVKRKSMISESDKIRVKEYYLQNQFKPKKIIHYELVEEQGISIGYALFNKLIN